MTATLPRDDDTLPRNYDTDRDPWFRFPFQVTVRMNNGQYRRHNSWVNRARALREARDMARYAYLNNWNLVVVHDCKTGNLIKTYPGVTYTEE